MKNVFKRAKYSTFALILIGAAAFGGSQISDRVREVALASIVIDEIKISDRILVVVGHADSNADISDFIRAIDNADLGVPALQKIERKSGVRYFVLEIKMKN
jgi:hypothetical protein